MGCLGKQVEAQVRGGRGPVPARRATDEAVASGDVGCCQMMGWTDAAWVDSKRQAWAGSFTVTEFDLFGGATRRLLI